MFGRQGKETDVIGKGHSADIEQSVLFQSAEMNRFFHFSKLRKLNFIFTQPWSMEIVLFRTIHVQSEEIVIKYGRMKKWNLQKDRRQRSRKN
mgnify:CR=1 FL=1